MDDRGAWATKRHNDLVEAGVRNVELDLIFMEVVRRVIVLLDQWNIAPTHFIFPDNEFPFKTDGLP